jgi:beta-glucosidase/6-phospho-beta-glucosidase/beta-galactosidase
MATIPMADEGLFQSFFLGGFECSTHRNRAGRRLDLIAATGHDRFAGADYLRLRELGIRTVRDGIRWHLIEQAPGRYDFSSALPMVRAACDAGTQVIWDLCHYGWPDDLDIFSAEFIERFAGLAYAFVKRLSAETDATPLLTPINEISYMTWAAGAVGIFYPYAEGRGDELKRQLVRAAIAGIEAIWSVRPDARICHIDPMCNIVADTARPEDEIPAAAYNRAQYEAWDMLCGRAQPELGGAEKYLDIVGVNYYIHNQWVYPGGHGTMIDPSHPRYRPVWEMLREVYERYRRPMFIAETGIEDDARSEWLRYIAGETRLAMQAGVPIQGICLYPIVNHPGWEDDRHCYNGLCDYADETGEREVYEPLARELSRHRPLLEAQYKAKSAS